MIDENSTDHELKTRVSFGHWFERIYSESDTGRGIATSIAGLFGLATYLFWQDWVVHTVSRYGILPKDPKAECRHPVLNLQAVCRHRG